MLVGDICIYTLDGTLNSEKARRALIQCTSIIVESTIDPIVLARKLYTNEIISEDVYRRLRDRSSRDTNEDRLDTVLDKIKDRVKCNVSVLTIFLDILKDLNRQDLADAIMSKYKGIIHFEHI